MSGLKCDSVGVDLGLIRGIRHGGRGHKSGQVRRSASRKGGADLLARMLAERSVCLRRLGAGHAGEVRYSRLLNSPRVTTREMFATTAAHCASRAIGRHLLAIQDSSEINYQAHAGRAKGLGPVGNGTDLGFFIHPVLVVDASPPQAGGGGIVGLAGGAIWKREGKVETARRKRAIADKESRRWIDAALASWEALDAADTVTQVCDREGDIYELFAVAQAHAAIRKPGQAHRHLLVRAAQDRALVQTEEATGEETANEADSDATRAHMFATAENLAERHRYAIGVPEKPGQKKRTATVAIGYGRVEIKRPQRLTRADLAKTVVMNVVVVREVDAPAACEPVRWVLLTTHTVDSLEGALEMVRLYRLRWHIEQLFRTLKTQGFNVEDSQVVEGHALMNLVTFALVAAMQTLQLTLARDGKSRQPIGDAFDAAEVEALAEIARGLPGKTQMQSNPHPPELLAWAAWIIARLGGWTGYASQKPPGPKTMHLGLTKFQNIAHGWNLNHHADRLRCRNV